jgi:hypothetical protein
MHLLYISRHTVHRHRLIVVERSDEKCHRALEGLQRHSELIDLWPAQIPLDALPKTFHIRPRRILPIRKHIIDQISQVFDQFLAAMK